MKKYTIAIAGTTQRTKQCAKELLKNEIFEILWILTPTAKPVGRKQIITPNEMEKFGRENNITTIFIEQKIDSLTKNKIQEQVKPDLLLVVDFGYIVPEWLLKIPKIAPLNIHPSELPKWRGSSPGQFTILFNEKKSAVTLMLMNEKLDQGPVIHQDFFAINHHWDHNDYYTYAFNEICYQLDKKIEKFAQNPQEIHIQPKDSPTIIANMIKKEHTFVPWEVILQAQNNKLNENESSLTQQLSELIKQAITYNNSLALTLERASKAFSPWPNLWTIIPTKDGEKRMKLLEIEYNPTSDSIEIVKVHIEGKKPALWSEIRRYYT